MDSVIATIHSCMQRGERPLSLVDLIERELLTLNQTAWLVSRIAEGSSWLVGAVPSHAGKTTLMSALLGFLGAGEEVTLARAGMPWASFGVQTCVVGEEISPNGRESYLWGAGVRALTDVPARGGRIASTIHANTLEEVREQVARQCSAGESGMAAFGIFIPIDVEFEPDLLASPSTPQEGKRRRRVSSRTVNRIDYHEGEEWKSISRDVKLTRQENSVADFLHSCLEAGTCTCEALRIVWLEKCR